MKSLARLPCLGESEGGRERRRREGDEEGGEGENDPAKRITVERKIGGEMEERGTEGGRERRESEREGKRERERGQLKTCFYVRTFTKTLEGQEKTHWKKKKLGNVVSQDKIKR